MQKRLFAFPIQSLFVVLALCATASAWGAVDSMQLLTPQTGWASTGRQIFWTTDAGLHWKDISPRMDPAQVLASTCFLDVSRGWGILVEHDAATGAPRFQLASTASAGASWSMVPLDIPDIDPSRGLSGRVWISFADPLHGWVMARMSGNTAVSIGVLLATQDGGRTWKSPSNGPPIAGPIRLVSAKKGWLAGGPDEQLYVTEDGGESWREVSLAAPPPMHPTAQATYELPIFEDGMHGSLPVSFAGPDDPKSAMALFVTQDGGKTWMLNGVLPQENSGWKTAVAGSAWITTGISGHTHTATTVHTASRFAANSAAPIRVGADLGNIAGVYNVEQLSFASATTGWALASGKVLATGNGGIGWTDVTPAEAAGAHVPAVADAPDPPFEEPAGAREVMPHWRRNPEAAPAVSQHLGFDISRVLPLSDMQAWWNDSPYWDTGLYLPGSPNRGIDANLNAAWVTAVQAQGWGLIPTWFGPQPPCACGPGSTDKPPVCKPFGHVIQSDPAKAAAQGVANADAALRAAETLDFSPDIIYQDVEYYTPSPACSGAVISYLNGWVGELHANGVAAGAYGAPIPVQQDFTQAPTLPDGVWVAKPDNRVTIWGLGSLHDNLWPSSQRIHQYQFLVETSYGGSISYVIDPDILDAPINVGHGSKSYNYTCTEPAVPGARAAAAYAINDMDSSGALINGSGQVGQVAGNYLDFSSQQHGFFENAGSFIMLNYPGAAGTYPNGMNDLTQVVGYADFFDQVTGLHKFSSFLYNAGALSVTFPNGGDEGYSDSTGINVAGQIVGSYGLGPGISGFLARAGSRGVTSFSYPATNSLGVNITYPTGINGAGKIVGDYIGPDENYHGFYNDPSAGQFVPIDYPGATNTWLYAINNNGQVLGLWEIVGDQIESGVFMYNVNDGSLTPLNADFGCCNQGGINDNAQIALGKVCVPAN